MSNLGETLMKARDLIDARGLAKSVFVDKDKCLCTFGAVMAALGIDPALGDYDDPSLEDPTNELLTTIRGYGDDAESRPDIYDWNDANLTTKEDVIKLFNDTIDRVAA